MKFALASLISSLLIGTAVSQGIAIGFPKDGASVAAGSRITVEVDRPDTLTGSTEVAIAIGINSCHNMACIPSGDVFGSILYNGPYNPQFQTGATFKPPHQNFTVLVPSSIAKGPAQLGVLHVSLVGAGPQPFTQVLNITLVIK
ncbi:hypothetical protein M413DRAFT_72371 [Hebeloma cylindrosporum]|uniref:Uncharacterized protein n=1 Tax=Hebeloma cylindrosporum TaxID=76867 RepID=A0A0C3C9I0_HEBCY|nr:hypothetical protein M413DRAFT_72371 [Hebeloma cylindrosporum h7]